MKYYENSRPNNYLNEYSYEQIKIINKKALDILNEFADEIFKMFFYIKKYITKPFQLMNILDNIYFLGKYNYDEVEYCLELSIKEQIQRHNGTIETYRYYYKDTGIVIYSLIYYKECLLKTESKRMLKFLTIEGQKERNKIKNRALKKLKKLQDELFFLIENDPTID